MFPNDLNFHHTKKPFYINLKVNFFLKKKKEKKVIKISCMIER